MVCRAISAAPPAGFGFDRASNRPAGAEDRVGIARSDAFQVDILSSLETTVVAPICPLSILKKPVRHLNPMLTINGEMYCI
ncbi:MAG: hypothetical protein D4R76_04035 [Methylococcus sp.]|nr:MAG: hypothetical protein D4R76_04035 [Methylococcus sp.]